MQGSADDFEGFREQQDTVVVEIESTSPSSWVCARRPFTARDVHEVWMFRIAAPGRVAGAAGDRIDPEQSLLRL